MQTSVSFVFVLVEKVESYEFTISRYVDIGSFWIMPWKLEIFTKTFPVPILQKKKIRLLFRCIRYNLLLGFRTYNKISIGYLTFEIYICTIYIYIFTRTSRNKKIDKFVISKSSSTRLRNVIQLLGPFLSIVAQVLAPLPSSD